MTLEEKIKEIEKNTESYRGYPAQVIDALLAALRKCRDQRDVFRDDLTRVKDSDDAELLSILSGSEK